MRYRQDSNLTIRGPVVDVEWETPHDEAAIGFEEDTAEFRIVDKYIGRSLDLGEKFSTKAGHLVVVVRGNLLKLLGCRSVKLDSQFLESQWVPLLFFVEPPACGFKCLFHRDQFVFSRFNLTIAPDQLLFPVILDIFPDALIEANNQLMGQARPFLMREGKHFIFDPLGAARHG